MTRKNRGENKTAMVVRGNGRNMMSTKTKGGKTTSERKSTGRKGNDKGRHRKGIEEASGQ
jgi:hypothetical protein